MTGDFTRYVFDPLKRFVRVLLQQGRVKLDADAAEPDAGMATPPQPANAEAPAPGSGRKIRKPD